jgi:hypothetical protein
MPLLATLGSASAKGFGFTLGVSNITYNYVGIPVGYAIQIYGGSSVSGMSILPTQAGSKASIATGVITDKSFIAFGGGAYSLNGGKSWTSWTINGTLGQTMAAGLNGGIAYNSTAKLAVTYTATSDPKTGDRTITASGVTSTGTTSSATVGTFTSNYSGGIIYSPTLNYFYIMNYDSGRNYCFGMSGTSLATNSSINIGGSNNTVNPYLAGLSSDGYPLQIVFTGGANKLRKFTATNLGTYTDYGVISNPYDLYYKSPFFWAPVNNKYYLANNNNVSNTNLIRVCTATSAAPQTYTLVGTITVPFGTGGGLETLSTIFEETDGTLYVCGTGAFYSGGKFSYSGSFTFYSTDAGVTWTQKSGVQFQTFSKNFT